MTIKEWLQNVHYDEYGQYLWSKDSDGGNQMIGEVRGWGELQNAFKTEDEAYMFQDEVGKFIAEAINEKVKRDFEGDKEGISGKENKSFMSEEEWVKEYTGERGRNVG